MLYPGGKKSNHLNIQHLLTSRDYEVLQVSKDSVSKAICSRFEDQPGVADDEHTLSVTGRDQASRSQ